MMKQDNLVKSLERIRKKLCAYVGKRCDCKFMNDDDDHICSLSEKGSGCPEIYTAIAIINSLTPAELIKVNKRSGLNIEPSKTKRLKGRKIQMDHETKQIIAALPNNISFALVRAFETAVKNVANQIKSSTKHIDVDKQSSSDKY